MLFPCDGFAWAIMLLEIQIHLKYQVGSGWSHYVRNYAIAWHTFRCSRISSFLQIERGMNLTLLAYLLTLLAYLQKHSIEIDKSSS